MALTEKLQRPDRPARGQWRRRWLWSAALVLFLAIQARAQDATVTNNPATNVVGATNTAGQTNLEALPAIPQVQPPEEYVPFQAQNSLTNIIAPPAAQPSPFGPARLGGPQPLAPILGTSQLAEPGEEETVLGPGIPVWGPLFIHPRLNYSLVYSDGLQAGPGEPGKTLVNTVTPGFLLDVGKNLHIDYGPSFAFYDQTNFKNTVNESVSLRGKWSNDDWVIGLTQAYTASTAPLVETGAETAEEAYLTGITAVRQLGSMFSMNMGLDQNFRFAEGLTSLHEWDGNDWLMYHPMKEFNVGLGAILGYDKVDPGSDMPYEQLQGKVTFVPGTKLTVTLTGGAEDRQFTGPSEPSEISPIYSGNIRYQLFEPTTITLSFSQAVTPSLFGNQVETITSFSSSLRQKLTKKITLGATAGYTIEPFNSEEPGQLPSSYSQAVATSSQEQVREDKDLTFNLSLSWMPVTGLSGTVFFSWNHNSSDQANFNYTARQIGLSLHYVY